MAQLKSPSVKWLVVKGDFVGNPERGFEHVYYCDLVRLGTREEAIRHGWEVHGHDDWLLLKLVDGEATQLAWMDEDRDDTAELREVAKQLHMPVCWDASSDSQGVES